MKILVLNDNNIMSKGIQDTLCEHKVVVRASFSMFKISNEGFDIVIIFDVDWIIDEIEELLLLYEGSHFLLVSINNNIERTNAFEYDIHSYVNTNNIETIIDAIFSLIRHIEKRKKIFHERLKSLRLKHGLSQSEIANMLGVTRSGYANYEQGVSEPSIEKLKKLSNIFYCSLDFLIGVRGD